MSQIKRIVCFKVIYFDQQVAYVVRVIVLRKRHQKEETQKFKKGFLLTSAAEAWWENNSKEDIENTNDRLKRKLELHRYK